MLANQRRDKILESLKEDGSAKVVDLVRLFKVTEVTIRQDLDKGAEPGIDVIMTGGEFKPPTLSLTGQKVADFFKGLNVQKLFLATAGISLQHRRKAQTGFPRQRN